ncbi:MAG: DUF3795 domain-containing protein [Pseudomonadota bacterium]
MSDMIAYCGLLCNKCPAYIATIEDDDKKRAETAKTWSEVFKADIKPENVNCLGCLHEGDDIFAHCKVCKIRACVKKKGFENCAPCSDYPCEHLAELFKMAPEAKMTLDKLR